MAHLGPTCPSCGYLGPSWSNFGASWGHLCVSWGLLGSVLAYFGAILGHLRTILGYLGPSWGYLEAVLGYLGPSWAVLGASWVQERFRNPRPDLPVPGFTDLDQFWGLFWGPKLAQNSLFGGSFFGPVFEHFLDHF